MPQIIEIPDIGQVEFPDGMSDADIARAIQNNYGTSPPQSPLGMGAARQKAEIELAASDPSIMGSFLRNARENIGGGVGALALGAAGAKGGAAIGAPLGPIGVGVGAVGGGLIGGIGGAFLGDRGQEIVDPMTSERELQIARDTQVNPVASYLGATTPYFAGMKPNIRGISTAFTKPTPLMGAIERNAINSARVELGVNTAIGAALPVGTALANDQPINPLEVGGNTVLGALLSAPNRFGRALGMKPTMTLEEARALQAEANPPAVAPVVVAPDPAASIIPQRGPLTPLAPAPAPPLVATGATRLASDLAQQAGIDPLTLTPSGADATVTPNDVRAAAENLPAATMDSGETIVITPTRKPDPTITDLIDSNIEWEGQPGRLVDDEGRPALLREDGSLVELPFSYATDRSLTDLGVQPTYDRQQDRATATRFFGESENESLQSVFGVIDNTTDDLLDIAELGVSLKRQKGKKSIPVHDTPEFAPQLRSITDEQILVAEDQIKQAITIAENNPNLTNETRTAVINKLSGDLENIAAITAARDAGKYQRLPLPVSSPEIPSQRASLAAADATSNANAARRILNNEPPLPADAPAAPDSAKLTIGPEETGIAPVAPENAGTPPIAPDVQNPQGSTQVEAPQAPQVPVRQVPVGQEVAADSQLDGVIPQAAESAQAQTEATVVPEPQRGDRFKDGDGNTWEVWKNRQGVIEAHPVVNGKVVINNQSGQRWAVSEMSKARNPEFRTDINPLDAPPVPITETQAEAPVAKKELSASTRARKLGAEIEATGKEIMAQRVKINELKKGGAPKQTITKAENQLASLQSTQKELVAQRSEANSEVPRVIKTASKGVSRILRSVDNNIDSFPGLSSLDGNKIKSPPPLLALILGKKKKGIVLSAKENNFLAENVKGGEYDGWIKISDIDAMPGTPEGKEAAKELLRSIYAKHDDYSARAPDNVVQDKDADTLWSELRSEIEDIAQGKTRDYQDESDAYYARLEEETLQKETANQPVSPMDIRNQDSRQLFDDDGGFALASENTQDGAKITAERNAKEEAARAQDEAQSRLFDEEGDDAPLFGVRPDEISPDNMPFSKTDAPARTADIAGVEKAADDFFGGKRPDNIKVVNEPKADWEARVNGDTIELNAAKVGPEGVRSALHEEVGHTAFRDEKERAVFQRLYDSLDEDTRTKINDTVDRLYSDAPTSVKAEEKLVKALRSILDRTPEGRTFWQKLLQIARRTYKTLTGQATKDPEMIAAALLKRGMGKVKAKTSGAERMSATPNKIQQRDADYLAAVENGDTEAAQRMVDEAAEKEGYQTIVEHGTHRDFHAFDRTKGQTGVYDLDGAGIWTTDSGKGSTYGSKVLNLYGALKNPMRYRELGGWQSWWEDYVNVAYPKIAAKIDFDQSGSKIHEQFRNEFKKYADRYFKKQGRDSAPSSFSKEYKDWLQSHFPGSEGYRKWLTKNGHDGVQIDGDFVDGELQTVRIFLESSQLKSTDAIVRDDAGNIIPLSERFNSKSDDIRYSKVDDAKPATSFREALDAAKQEVADRADYRTQAKTVLAEIARLPKDQQKPARIRMYAELDEARVIGKGKDQQFKVEMPKVAQELIAGGRTPNEQDILNALVAKFPEQKGYLKKNFERLVTDMMFAEEMAMSGNKTPWGDYGDAMKEHLAEIASGVKDGSTLRHIQRGLSLFRNTYFNGIGGKMQALAEGKITGKDSAAANKFFADIMGVRASQDGVNFEGADGLSEADLRRMNNERIKFDTDLDAYFKKEGINDAARAAWLERVSDHVVNPARDAELAKEPKLKEAVDYFIKRRRDRLAYLRNAGVDVGDAGERSLSRSIDTEKVLTNPKEFVEKAKRAYMRKWAREISLLRDQEAIKAAEGKDTTSIKDKIRELEKMDAQAAAEKYLYAITSDNNGISSDGNDITAAEGGGQPSFLKKREFGPEADELLGKFYHRNIAAMDTAEALATVRAATKARVLSSRSDGKIDPVGKWKALRAQLEAEGNQDMIPIAAQLVKDYLNLNGSNNETVRRLVGHLHTYTQLAYLSHATVASLGEPALIGARTGRITDTGRAYAQIAKGIVRALRKAGPDEIRILNRELGLVADSFDGLMSSNALGDSFGGRGKGGGLVTNFHRLTGLSGWTNLTFDAATKIGKSFISSQVKLAKAGGSMSNLAKRELNELGMSTKDIDVMAAFVTKLDKATDQNKLILGDDPGAALYRKALSMFHKTGAALNPTRGTRAQKANNPVAGMFYQLQSFLYDFHQKFTLRQARRLKDAYRGTMEIDGATEKLSTRERSQVAIDAAKAIAAIYSLQYGIQVLRETIFVDLERNKRDKEKTQAEINMARALGAASRTGILGPYDTLFNIVSGARYQREPATVVLGPAVGGMSELFQSVVNLYGDRNSANTNTAERKLARTGYNTIATPALNAVFAGMPAGPLSAALVQAFRHPLARESAVSAVAGPIQTKKKGPMKTTTYY